MAYLEQSGSQVPNACPVKLTFSLTVTFYLTKTANKTKKFLTQSKNADFLLKNADISKFKKKVLVLYGIFSETTNICVLTYQISSF